MDIVFCFAYPVLLCFMFYAFALSGRVFKIALKSHTFFAYSIDALDGQLWRKVFIRPFLNVAMSSFLQSLFEIEINSPVLVSQIKA